MKKTILLFTIILITGCELIEITGKHTEIIPIIKEEGNINIYFCPREDCAGALTELITNAKESVHCGLFELEHEKVITALNEKSKSIDVKVVVDGDYHKEVEDYNWVKAENKSKYQHNKFCIIDGKKVSTGSFNPTTNGANRNNNNLIIIESAGLAVNYEEEFSELWKGVYGKGKQVGVPTIYLNETKIESYFCPEDHCSEQIIRVLENAKESIYFMTFSFTHENIANAILMKNLENITIKGIFEKTGTGSQYSKYNLFEYQGIPVIKDNNTGAMHHKVFIIDEKIVITGSFNPSANADNGNDENIIIIYDEETAKEYLKEFDYLWDKWS